MGLNLIDSVKNAGVVGAGGAGFPTHIKLQSQNIDYVIANGVECEPLLNADRLLMTHYAAEIVQGLKVIKEHFGAKEAIIAIKKKNDDAIKIMESYLESGIRFHLLDDIYPMGDEQVLIYEVTGRVIPPAGLPLDVGVVVNNVATIYQIDQALQGQPFIQRLVTVTGCVKNPLTLRLPIGVSIQEAINMAGGPVIGEYSVLNGGPMMGKLVSDLSEPITKTTSGLIILPNDHPLVIEKRMDIRQMVKRSKAVCCRCESCSQVCPRGLLGHGLKPHKIMRAVSHNLADPVLVSAYLCSECGLCIYACDMGLSPRKINQAVKEELRKAGVKNQPDGRKIEPHQMRQYRQIPGKRLEGRFRLQNLPHKTPLGEGVMPLLEQSGLKMVKIPLLQHLGFPAVPLVQMGDTVKKGQLIGQIPQGKLGGNIHASITGKVVQVDDYIHIQGS